MGLLVMSDYVGPLRAVVILVDDIFIEVVVMGWDEGIQVDDVFTELVVKSWDEGIQVDDMFMKVVVKGWDKAVLHISWYIPSN